MPCGVVTFFGILVNGITLGFFALGLGTLLFLSVYLFVRKKRFKTYLLGIIVLLTLGIFLYGRLFLACID